MAVTILDTGTQTDPARYGRYWAELCFRRRPVKQQQGRCSGCHAALSSWGNISAPEAELGEQALGRPPVQMSSPPPPSTTHENRVSAGQALLPLHTKPPLPGAAGASSKSFIDTGCLVLGWWWFGWVCLLGFRFGFCFWQGQGRDGKKEKKKGADYS